MKNLYDEEILRELETSDCSSCVYFKRNNDLGHCYMFKFYIPNCNKYQRDYDEYA